MSCMGQKRGFPVHVIYIHIMHIYSMAQIEYDICGQLGLCLSVNISQSFNYMPIRQKEKEQLYHLIHCLYRSRHILLTLK